MELYYKVRFLKQEFKRRKLTRETAVITVDLKAKSESMAMDEAEFLVSVNNPEISYDCIVCGINYSCNQFKYEVKA